VSPIEPGLPVEFVIALAAKADAGTAVALFTADRARTMPEGADRERLLTELLASAFRCTVPVWLIEAAIDQGLADKGERWAGSGIDLAATALGHPDCDAEVRAAALRGCTDVQLGSLGSAHRPDVLTTAVAAELGRRSPGPEPMTRDLLVQPTAAQQVLQTAGLADLVFDTAFELLPPRPLPRKQVDTTAEDRYEQFRNQLDAWEAMWRTVLVRHPDRYAQFVERTEGARRTKRSVIFCSASCLGRSSPLCSRA
jgi:hypothetical protein